jgi:hypothetical protein
MSEAVVCDDWVQGVLELANEPSSNRAEWMHVENTQRAEAGKCCCHDAT